METQCIKWELVKNGRTVVASFEQSIDDLLTNGRGYPLGWIIPEEHAEEAIDTGEWDEEGFVYEIGDDWYLVRYYPIAKESPEGAKDGDTGT